MNIKEEQIKCKYCNNTLDLTFSKIQVFNGEKFCNEGCANLFNLKEYGFLIGPNYIETKLKEQK